MTSKAVSVFILSMTVRLYSFVIPLLYLMLLLFAVPLVHGKRITVAYEAEAATVINSPFGLAVPRLTIVSGYFTYESSAMDLNPGDLRRGRFLLSGGWDFRAEFLGKVITGSDRATASTNTFATPTLSFEDGSTTGDSGIMSLDGIPNKEIALNFRISGKTEDLPTDQLPAEFGFQSATHTFVIADDSGRMLLQFRSFQQVDLSIKSITREGDIVEIEWCALKEKRYRLEYSSNLRNWSIIQDDLAGNPMSSTLSDNLAFRFLAADPIPLGGFYRIVDRATAPPD